MIRGRFPPPLAWLLASVGLIGVIWALFVPAFQAPDESAHFAYVQSLAERGKLPERPDSAPMFSTEEGNGIVALDGFGTVGQPLVKVEWSRAAFERWQQAEAGP